MNNTNESELVRYHTSIPIYYCTELCASDMPCDPNLVSSAFYAIVFIPQYSSTVYVGIAMGGPALYPYIKKI